MIAMGSHVGVEEPDDLEAWYRRHRRAVDRAVRRFGASPEDADDLVQEVFLLAHRRRQAFTGGSTRAWLLEIARRLVSNHRRARRRRAEALTRATTTMTMRHRDPRGPDVGVACRHLQRFFATLTPPEREVFLRSEVGGASAPEIAEAMSCTLAAAYGRVRAVRERFAVACEEGIVGDRRPARRRHGAWILAWPAVIRRVALLPTLGKLGLVAVATLFILLPSASDRRPSPRSEAAGTVTQPAVARSDARAIGGTAVHVDAAAAEPASIERTPAEVLRAAETADPVAMPARVATSARRRILPRDEPAKAARSPAAESDAALVEAARDLRDGRAARALERLDRHAAAHPASSMLDVAAALRIEALVDLGRVVEARQAAAAFVHAHPRSPVARRVKRAVRDLD